MRNGNLPVYQIQGFTYLGILIAVAIIGVSLSATGMVWHTVVQREREADLLYIGGQYRQAIASYHRKNSQFPKELTDLTRDPNDVTVIHHLRKVYNDPITGSNEWGIVKDKTGNIIGVFSRSEQRPIKQGQFTTENQTFAGMEKYSDWQFIYVPKIGPKHPVRQSANTTTAAQQNNNGANTPTTTNLPTQTTRTGTIRP